MLAEALAQPVPVERPGARVQEVRDVGAVVALALHHERLRPDHLLDRAEQDRHVQHARGHRVVEPVVVHHADAVARVEDQVHVIAALADLAEPVREGQLGVAAQLLTQMVKRFLDVGAAHEEVEVLHEPPDAQVALERVPAAHQEVDVRRAQRLQDAPIEAKGARGCRRKITPRPWRAVLGHHGLAH